ncbi:MAG: sulfite exporter TauE/SafE family protein [Gemmatimonadales bacterium]|nr:sulfite exporter TauE/SafE family protein [Gemmatimonadales bacterium]
MLAAAAIGLILGLRHAFEPDHLAAVSTLATRETRLWPAARLGLAWGVGHTATVGIVALLIIALGIRLPESLWPLAELVVAGLLVLLGSVVVWRYARGRWHLHVHSHQSSVPHVHLHSHASATDHEHAHAPADTRRSLGFGIAHGLAGSGAVVALLVAAAPDGATRIAHFAAFGLGTIVGMLAVSVTLAALVRMASARGAQWATGIHVGAALASVIAGFALAGQVIASR